MTLDAGPSDPTTAAMIVADRGADEGMTAIKDNQPTRLAQRPVMPWDDRVSVQATVDQGHGRREWRRSTVLDVSTPEPAQRIAMDGRAQVAPVERRRQNSKSGEGSQDVTDGVTSLTTAPADAAKILERVRSH